MLTAIAYVFLLMVSASSAVLLALLGQRGHITAFHALLAPLLGPWSPILPPNAHGIAAWPMSQVFMSASLTSVLAVSMVYSYLAKPVVLRIGVRLLSMIVLLAWVGCGISKVILELA